MIFFMWLFGGPCSPLVTYSSHSNTFLPRRHTAVYKGERCGMQAGNALQRRIGRSRIIDRVLCVSALLVQKKTSLCTHHTRGFALALSRARVPSHSLHPPHGSCTT